MAGGGGGGGEASVFVAKARPEPTLDEVLVMERVISLISDMKAVSPRTAVCKLGCVRFGLLKGVRYNTTFLTGNAPMLLGLWDLGFLGLFVSLATIHARNGA